MSIRQLQLLPFNCNLIIYGTQCPPSIQFRAGIIMMLFLCWSTSEFSQNFVRLSISVFCSFISFLSCPKLLVPLEKVVGWPSNRGMLKGLSSLKKRMAYPCLPGYRFFFLSPVYCLLILPPYFPSHHLRVFRKYFLLLVVHHSHPYILAACN